MFVIFKGMLIGFAAIAPIGMQNIYVFNNALTNNIKKALFYAFFIWFSDAIFEIAAFYGMGALISSNEIFKLMVMGVGGALLIYIARGILKDARASHFDENTQVTASQTLGKVLLSSLLLVWANPQALIDGSLILGALHGTLSGMNAIYFISGVLLATILWFYGITLFVGLLKEKLPKFILVWVNIISGAIVLIYGIYLVIHVLIILFQ
nr:LysE family transporter [Lactococcus allomyrinae]